MENRLEDDIIKNTLILFLIKRFQDNESWCSETHMQKSIYFIQNFFSEFPLNFEFVLYKYGPFSFDLREKLFELFMKRYIHFIPKPYPYGPSIELTESGKIFIDSNENEINKYKQEINFISKEISKKVVSELEKLSIALYVKKAIGENSGISERVKKIVELKPHIKNTEAEESIYKLDEMITNSKKLIN